MNTKLYISRLILLCLLLSPISIVNAEAEYYKNRISFGGYFISKYDSEIGITNSDVGAGVAVNPRTALGMTNEETVFRLDGHYRFNDNHSLMYSWYSINSTGRRTIDEEIPWDPPVPVGADISSTIKLDLFKVGYLWSFYNNEKVELGIGAGLHFTQFGVELNAESTGTPYKAESVRTTVPLPVIMFKLGYNITPKWKMSYVSQIFALEFEGVSGTYSDQTLGMEYMFWEYVGLGIGLNGTNLAVDKEDDSKRIILNSRISGAILYISGHF